MHNKTGPARRLSRKAVGLSLAAAIILLPGCGSRQGASVGPPIVVGQANAVEHAMDTIAAIGTARVTQTLTTTYADGTSKTAVFVSQLDFRRGIDEFDLAPPGHGVLRMVVSSAFAYANNADLSQGWGAKPWLRFNYASAQQVRQDPKVSALVNDLLVTYGSDPRSALYQLTGVTGTVTNLGSDHVGSTQTTHYRFAVDLAKEARSAPADVQPFLKGLANQVNVSSSTQDAWLDTRGAVLKIHDARTYLPTPRADGLPPTTATDETTELYDLGGIVVISVPDPNQVTDVRELVRAAGSGSSPPISPPSP